MNMKLKAFLIALGYVTTPFIFVFVAFKYPLVVLFAAISLIVWLVYNRVLDNLMNADKKKNGVK